MTDNAENDARSTGAIVPERQRCICNDGLCLDHCRACNHSGRDLEEPCIADPDWQPDDEYLAIRETRVIPPAQDYPDMPCEDCEQGLSSCCIPPGKEDS